MSKEQIESLIERLSGIAKEIEAIPGSSGIGQLIDSVSHIKSCTKHLERYFALVENK